VSATFHIGEIAILQNANHYPEFNGDECEVVSGLTHHFVRKLKRMVYCYGVQLADGRVIGAEPHQLRKRRPPTECTGEARIRELFNVAPVREPELV
jgi:hypothetical protein